MYEDNIKVVQVKHVGTVSLRTESSEKNIAVVDGKLQRWWWKSYLNHWQLWVFVLPVHICVDKELWNLSARFRRFGKMAEFLIEHFTKLKYPSYYNVPCNNNTHYIKPLNCFKGFSHCWIWCDFTGSGVIRS